MFTGIIEEVGIIKSLEIHGPYCQVCIDCKKVVSDVSIGDSIAVNGICLTVTNATCHSFSADVMTETLKRTGLSNMRIGTKVNLERAMIANGRFGGHMVTGHIDGTGTIRAIEKQGNSTWYTITAAPNIVRYIVEKGSIAIDGISLTVAYVDSSKFKVSIIPHTSGETTLSLRKSGDKVNLESDILAKYVEKTLERRSNVRF